MEDWSKDHTFFEQVEVLIPCSKYKNSYSFFGGQGYNLQQSCKREREREGCQRQFCVCAGVAVVEQTGVWGVRSGGTQAHEDMPMFLTAKRDPPECWAGIATIWSPRSLTNGGFPRHLWDRGKKKGKRTSGSQWADLLLNLGLKHSNGLILHSKPFWVFANVRLL